MQTNKAGKHHVCIVNEMYSDNIGDQAIADSMRAAVEYTGHSVRNFDFSFRKKASEVRTNAGYLRMSEIGLWRSVGIRFKSYRKVVPRSLVLLVKSCTRVILAYRLIGGESDVVIVGGGQLILGNRNFSAAMLSWCVAAKLRKKKLCLISIGVGTSFCFIDRLFYKLSLALSDSVLVRDKESLSTLRKVFRYKSASLIPDSVYFFTKDEVPMSCHRVVVAPVEYQVHLRYCDELGSSKMSRESYSALWMDIVRRHQAEGSAVVITATTSADYEFSKSIFHSLKCDNSNLQLEYCASWMEFIALVKFAERVISGRMHALILAQTCGVRIESVGVSRKIKAFDVESARCDPNELKQVFISKINSCLDTPCGCDN